MLFLISTLTWVTEKELEPVIENKVEEFRWEKTWKFHSNGEKMRNASGQVKMGGSEKIKANMTLETKSLVSTYDNSSKK